MLRSPPATSTFPLFSNVAVCESRALVILPVNTKSMQVTTTLVTLALATVPLAPAVTPQVCAGLEGCENTVTLKVLPLAMAVVNVKLPLPCADRQVVAAIVLQHKSRAGETRDRAADGVGICGAGDHHARDIGAGDRSARTGGYPAGLRRVGRLRKYRDAKSAAAGDGRGEREVSVCADRQVVAAIVLQHKPRARKTRDRAADGVAICVSTARIIASSSGASGQSDAQNQS